MLDRDRVVDAELRGPLRIDGAPHHVASRAARRHGRSAGREHAGDVGAHHTLELLPLAGDEHGRRAAELPLSQVGEVDAGLVEQPHGADADVALDVARRAAGEVDRVGGVLGTMLLPEVLRKPGRAILAIPGPDIALCLQRRAHHLEGRQRHALVIFDHAAAQFHPAWLDRQHGRAARVADLAGRAGDEGVDHLLAPALAALEELAQPVPLAARALALPAAPVELVTLVDTVAALRARVGIEGDVGGDAAHRSVGVGRGHGLGDHAVAQRADDRLEGGGQRERLAQGAAADHLAGVEHAARVGLALELAQAPDALGAQDVVGPAGEVHAGRVGTAAVLGGDVHDGEHKAEDEVVVEADAGRRG